MKPLVVLSLFAALTLSAQAQVLLTDTFDRSGALDGSSPDYSASPGTTWTSSTNFTTNGTSATIAPSGGSQDLAYLAIPGASSGLTLNDTYPLTVTMGGASGGSWLGAGFGDVSDTGSVSYGGGNTSSPLWALYNTDGSVAIFSGGNDITGAIPAATVGAPALVTLSITPTIINNTLTDLVSATFDGKLVLNDGQISPTAIPDVFIDRYEDGGSFSNLSVTAPEPATWAMLMLGGVGLVLLARTRLLKA